MGEPRVMGTGGWQYGGAQGAGDLEVGYWGAQDAVVLDTWR